MAKGSSTIARSRVALIAAPAPPPTYAAAATPAPDLATIQQQLQQLVAIMAATTTATPSVTPAPRPNNQPGRSFFGRGRGRGRAGNRGGTPPSPRMYCWTHGACAHSSADCNNQAPVPYPGVSTTTS